jgi:hypothetical protein
MIDGDPLTARTVRPDAQGVRPCQPDPNRTALDFHPSIHRSPPPAFGALPPKVAGAKPATT